MSVCFKKGQTLLEKILCKLFFSRFQKSRKKQVIMPWLNAGQLVIWSDELLLVRRLFLLFTLVSHLSFCRSIYQFCSLRPNSRTKVLRGFLLVIYTQQTRSDLCIPRKEAARPRSQFPHSCIGLPILLQQTDHGNI
jgi:hypothetical protein